MGQNDEKTCDSDKRKHLKAKQLFEIKSARKKQILVQEEIKNCCSVCYDIFQRPKNESNQ
jgi:hypothetical protein